MLAFKNTHTILHPFLNIVNENAVTEVERKHSSGFVLLNTRLHYLPLTVIPFFFALF